MASTNRAPKQWCLSKTETVNSFENWKQNLIYSLYLDPIFSAFLSHDAKWAKKSKANPNRDFTDDEDPIPENKRLTAQQKSATLDLMLSQIANYCPVISRNVIVKNSTSLEQIWQSIRLHFGFQSSGAHFLDLNDITLRPDERPEDLYQRLLAFIDDNLLKKEGGITHHGANIEEDEELSPTVENLIVLTWLRLINTSLPQLVKQRYGTELRVRTLASIKPEISQALPSLLEEIRNNEDARSFRTFTQPHKDIRTSYNQKPPIKTQNRSCPLCKQAKRTSTHFLSECRFLPDSDRKYMAKARQILSILDTDQHTDSDVDNPDEAPYAEPTVSLVSNRVSIRQSPYLDVFFQHSHVRLTIDSGATGNMIRASTVTKLNGKVSPTNQSAHQADGSSPLKVVGETKLHFSRDSHSFYFEGLVIENLDVDALAGIPFMEANDIAVRPSKRQVLIGNSTVYTYGSVAATDKTIQNNTKAHVLRTVAATTVWPGDYLELDIPDSVLHHDGLLAIQPHLPGPLVTPSILHSVGNKIRIENTSSDPVTIRKHEHLCDIRQVYVPSTDPVPSVQSDTYTSLKSESRHSTPFSSLVTLDPDGILPSEIVQAFKDTLAENDTVFSPVSEGYNGYAGPFKAEVNTGPVMPPQRKGRLPQYSRNQLELLQTQFNELEAMGVFKKPEDVGITVEYLNPSFLVKKGSGGFRLVTAFSEVARYCKPQPSLMPNVDSILRIIGQWKYLAVTDLTKAFYQIPLAKGSMKYCGVVSPFRGIRVYTRSAMGMPGSETALGELTCRVLGDLLEEGIVVKLADDLYCGADTPSQLVSNFSRVLAALNRCNLKLSASKTVIAPCRTTILGWIWEQGTLSASPHRIATLASCELPSKVKAMRSFLGAYKVLSRVIPGCSSLLAPMEESIAGLDSKDTISWSDDLIRAFHLAQQALEDTKSIHIPHPQDTLWIVTDGALRKPGIGATLYVSRGDNKLLLAGFFSAKLRKCQVSWLPCEIEALSIGTAVKHYSPYIVQSLGPCCILTDSKPCVMAYDKLCRGEFSTSPRVYTFLSTVSRYQVSVRHVAGAAILPSDHSSRNAPECIEPNCQICSFVSQSMDSVVRNTSVSNILDGSSKLPFTTRSAWLAIQPECSDLRRTCAHLRQGTRPSRKATNIKDIKRYLNVATIASDGLLVVKHNDPFVPSKELIIIPRSLVHGLLTSIHIQLSHPSANQMKTVMKRFFYALDMDKAIVSITSACSQCSALQKVPHFVIEQTTSDPPETIGSTFAADVMKREKQLIFIMRECISSYTTARIIEDERAETLRTAIIQSCIELRPMDGPFAVVRTDPAPGFQALVKDKMLQSHRISVELGRFKNTNKNPIAERAVQEIREHILKIDPTARAVSPLLLSLAVASVNSTIRQSGLSARELLTQRDQFTNRQLPISDRDCILQKHLSRIANHPSSEKSKAPHQNYPPSPTVEVGDLVYLFCDRNKSKARNRYLVVSTDGDWCQIRKFVGNQLRQSSYKVKKSECYRVPSSSHDQSYASDSDSEEEVLGETLHHPRDNNEDIASSPYSIPPTPLEIMSPLPDISSLADNTSDSEIPESTSDPLESPPSAESTGKSPTRPRRTIRLPSRFQDFEM